MSTRPYELLVRFGADSTVTGASVRRITTLNGKDYESDPEPLSGVNDPEFFVFAEQFAAAAVAERDQLRQQLNSLTDQNATLQAQVDTIAGLQSQIDTLKADLAAMTADRDAWQAQVPPPAGPREVTPEAFCDRFTVEQVVAIQLSTVPLVVYARTLLQTRTSLINLDADKTRQLVGGLVQAQLLTEDEAAKLLE